MQPADPRKRELALIHMAKAHLGLSEADYRYVIAQVTGTEKTSAADLTAIEREKLLRHFKAKGFKVKAKPAAQRPLRDPQHKKLRAMWYALADVSAVERPADAQACDVAIETWAKRQLASSPLGKLDALRFATGAQLNKLIEDMKAWGLRVGADIES